jgi:NADPH:quinone reductase-like Zn-dependent oxidoreductase
VILDILASFRWFHAWLYGIYFDGFLMHNNSTDLQKVATWVNEGKLKPVVGKTVRLEDIEAVREACVQMSSSSRSIGKVVIEVI